MARRYGGISKYYRGKKSSAGSAATTARIAIFTVLIFMACLARYADIPLLSALRQGMSQTLEANTDYIGAVEVLGRAVAGEDQGDENTVLVFGRKLLGLDGDKEDPQQTTAPETTEAEEPQNEDEYIFPWEDEQGGTPEEDRETEKATAGGYSGLAFGNYEYSAEAVMPVFAVSHNLSSSLLWDEMDDSTPNEEFTIPSPDIVDDTVYSLPFKYAAPATGRITSYFGYRIHPISGNTTFHHGADLGVQTGTTVKAFADGTVVETGDHSVYGLYIKIEHEGGFISMYAHLDKILVKKGKKVSLGDKIAQSGNTGYSTGAHLHFELRRDGKILNPFDYLSFE